MSKQSAMMKLVDKLVEREEERIRHMTRQMMCDYAMIAMGRMGWGEKRLKEFSEMIGTVADEFSTMIIEDYKDDTEIDYSKGKLDEELKQYCGKSFVPYDERYAY